MHAASNLNGFVLFCIYMNIMLTMCTCVYVSDHGAAVLHLTTVLGSMTARGSGNRKCNIDLLVYCVMLCECVGTTSIVVCFAQSIAREEKLCHVMHVCNMSHITVFNVPPL